MESPDEMKADIAHTGFVKTHLVDGALNPVLAFTKLELISNDSLKRMLTAYPARIREFKESENDLVLYVNGVHRPLFRSYTDLSDFLLNEPRFEDFKQLNEPSDYEGLLSNREYMNTVIGIRGINTGLLVQCENLHKQTHAIYLIVQEALSK